MTDHHPTDPDTDLVARGLLALATALAAHMAGDDTTARANVLAACEDANAARGLQSGRTSEHE